MDFPLQDSTSNGKNVFFYGLFMDMEALRDKGLRPIDEQIVTVSGYVVRLRAKAVLLEAPGGVATGVLARIPHMDFHALYDHQTDYRKIQVTALTQSGALIQAVTMVHRDPEKVGSTDPVYSARWHDLTARLNIPLKHVTG